ncbi:ketopantoate reductase [Pseudomonas sp. GM60]|nr:ketopantoate reductase [Pseudomonas sp. GM60]
MRILIVGAGSTGGFFGAKLASAGRDVTFLVRPQRLSQLEQLGLCVKSPAGDIEYNRSSSHQRKSRALSTSFCWRLKPMPSTRPYATWRLPLVLTPLSCRC